MKRNLILLIIFLFPYYLYPNTTKVEEYNFFNEEKSDINFNIGITNHFIAFNGLSLELSFKDTAIGTTVLTLGVFEYLGVELYFKFYIGKELNSLKGLRLSLIYLNKLTSIPNLSFFYNKKIKNLYLGGFLGLALFPYNCYGNDCQDSRLIPIPWFGFNILYEL